jgi:cyclopropane fatty-acyl-phospholipid synthase-like methyltransferase
MQNIKEVLKKCLDDQNINFYQTFTINGEEINQGIRKNERRTFIDLKDILNKNILDLGCATGAECVWAVEKGANSATGIDKGEEQIQTFKNVIQCLNFAQSPFNNKINAISFDLNQKIDNKLFNNKIDTIFCFAINQYVGYRKLWYDIPEASVIYVEGGADSGFTENNLTDAIYIAKYLGNTPSNSKNYEQRRPFFKLIKK